MQMYLGLVGRITVGLLTAICFVALSMSPAAAQGTFNGQAKAKGGKLDCPRLFEECPSDDIPAPNTVTEGGLDACSPPATLSPFRFGPKGTCQISYKPKLTSSAVNCTAPLCVDMKIKAKCSDIREPGSPDPNTDGPPIDDGSDASASGWFLRLALNVTTADVTEDMTAPLTIYAPFGAAKNGKMQLKTTLSEILEGDQDLFPAPTSYQVRTIDVVDTEIVGFCGQGDDGGASLFAVEETGAGGADVPGGGGPRAPIDLKVTYRHFGKNRNTARNVTVAQVGTGIDNDNEGTCTRRRAASLLANSTLGPAFTGTLDQSTCTVDALVAQVSATALTCPPGAVGNVGPIVAGPVPLRNTSWRGVGVRIANPGAPATAVTRTVAAGSAVIEGTTTTANGIRVRVSCIW